MSYPIFLLTIPSIFKSTTQNHRPYLQFHLHTIQPTCSTNTSLTMPSLSHVSPTKFGLALSSALRRYSTSSPSFYPALASTTSTTQPKNSPSKLAHEWKESTATLSEADVSHIVDVVNLFRMPESPHHLSLTPVSLLSHYPLFSFQQYQSHQVNPSQTPQVKADRDAIDAELHSAKVEREIAAFGETGWKKAFWAD